MLYIISFLIPPCHQILKSPQAEENRESIQPGHLDFDIFSIQSWMLDLCLNVVLAKINTIRHTTLLYMYQRSLNQGSSCICRLYDPWLTSCTLIPLSQQKSHHAFSPPCILCSDICIHIAILLIILFGIPLFLLLFFPLFLLLPWLPFSLLPAPPCPRQQDLHWSSVLSWSAMTCITEIVDPSKCLQSTNGLKQEVNLWFYLELGLGNSKFILCNNFSVVLDEKCHFHFLYIFQICIFSLKLSRRQRIALGCDGSKSWRWGFEWQCCQCN